MDSTQPPTAPPLDPGVLDRSTDGPSPDVLIPDTVRHFDGVYVLTAGPAGPTAVPGLQLDIDTRGLTVAKADGTMVWQVEWTEVAELSTPERSRLPGGQEGVVLAVATHEAREHRFVLPAPDQASVEASLGTVASARGLVPAESGRRLPVVLVVAVVLMTAAVVTALLLAAGHVIS